LIYFKDEYKAGVDGKDSVNGDEDIGGVINGEENNIPSNDGKESENDFEEKDVEKIDDLKEENDVIKDIE